MIRKKKSTGKKRKKSTKTQYIEVPVDDAQVFLDKQKKYLELAIKEGIMSLLKGEGLDVAYGEIYGSLNIAKIIKCNSLKIEITYQDLIDSKKTYDEQPFIDDGGSEQGDSGDPTIHK